MTVFKILKQRKLRPFKDSVHQELREGDMPRRLAYCDWLIDRYAEDQSFVKKILFTDECTFHLDGTVNRYNRHYWAAQNPHLVAVGHMQRRRSVNVWAGTFGNKIIGPVIFQGNVNGPTYENFLSEVLPVLLEDVPLATRQTMWFQQDGHPAHTSRAARAVLDRMFEGRWIGLHGPREWPPRSPDLTPPDFFLWPYIKNTVYQTRPRDINDLKLRIRDACLAITPETLARVHESAIKRANECADQNGGHFEHLRV